MTYNPKIELLDLGSAIQPVAVVDGFASSPDLWRSRALGEGYDFRGDFYPGQRKHVDHSYFDDVGAQLGAIMRAVFGCKKSLKVDRALYSIVDEHPGRLSLAQRIPHFDDSSDDAYAVVHYLAHDAYGGTAFFRHRTTDLAQITASRHADYLAALRKDFATHGEPKAGYIRGSTEIF